MRRHRGVGNRTTGAIVARGASIAALTVLTACSPAPTSNDAASAPEVPRVTEPAPIVPQTPSGPPTLAMTYGEPLAATTDDAIVLPLVVRVYRGPEQPAVGVPVHFAMKSGSGSVNPLEAVTDARGEATATLTFPYDELNVVEATTPLGGVTTISVASYRNHEGIIRSINGPFIDVPRNKPRAVPVTVRVVGRDGSTPLASRALRFTVELGGGTLSAATAVTNELGEATVTWTLTSTPAVNRLIVTGDRLVPVTIHAIAP